MLDWSHFQIDPQRLLQLALQTLGDADDVGDDRSHLQLLEVLLNDRVNAGLQQSGLLDHGGIE